MIEIARDRALALLSECTGDHIWSVEHCRARRVPERWVEELSDAFESNFRTMSQTIFVENEASGQYQSTNQYEGVRDYDLAIRIARSLGLDVDRVTASALGRRGIVAAIKESMMDGE